MGIELGMDGSKSQNRILVVLITLMFASLPEIGMSLGLGQIKLYSYLNEPLEAEIELIGAEDLGSERLRVNLASVEDFKKTNLARPYFLNKLRFQVVKEANRTFIQVTSSAPVKQPYLEFLLEITWSEGRLVREYTLLLDPTSADAEDSFEPRPSSSSSKKVAFNDDKALRSLTEKLSKNSYVIKPKQVASAANTVVLEEEEKYTDPAVQHLEPLFDDNPIAKVQSNEKTYSSSLESPEGHINASRSSEKSLKVAAEEEIAIEKKNPIRKNLYENRLLLGSSLGLLLSVSLTIWILKRARESLKVSPTFANPLLEKPLFDEEISIKFDLAKQYFALKDYPSTRAILDEILERGNSQEIERAKALLEKIPT